MRADLLERVTLEMSARAAALVILISDYECLLNNAGGEWGGRYRTLESFQKYNPRITRWTMHCLMKDGWAEPHKLGWRLKVSNG